MMNLSTRERATAIVSALAAIAILGLGVTAQPTRTGPGDRLARLESDLRYQLELDSRIDPAKYAARTKTLDMAINAWRASRQTPEDFDVIHDWLRGALVKSLPGGDGTWPEAPVFSAEPPTVHTTQKVAVPEGSALLEAPALVETRPAGQLAMVEPVTPVTEAPALVTPSAKTQAAQTTRKDATPAAPGRRTSPPTVVQQPTPSPSGPLKDVASRPAPTAGEVAKSYSGMNAELVPASASAAVTPAANIKPVAVPKRAPIAVNLAELNARINGYHEGLREVESAIVAGREKLTVGKIAKQVNYLEQLAGHYQFVRLYYDSLTPEERRAVSTPRSMAATVKLVESERSRVEAAQDDDFLASNEVVEDGELALRLKALAEVADEPREQRCCD